MYLCDFQEQVFRRKEDEYIKLGEREEALLKEGNVSSIKNASGNHFYAILFEAKPCFSQNHDQTQI